MTVGKDYTIKKNEFTDLLQSCDLCETPIESENEQKECNKFVI
ncbi:hypothetical protein [Clostridium sp. YIM B02569]|nr:hypothetical protein [Clostridium sp. YIM B02569]